MVDELGLTSSRWQVLGAIHNRPTTVPRLARRLGLTRQSVQRTTDHLVKDGLARLRSNPDHKRSSLVVLTDQGSRLLTEAQIRYEGWADLIGSGLTGSDLAAACRLLNAVSQRLADAEPPGHRQ